MNSLFGQARRSNSTDLLRLPALCVPAANEPDYLRSKREAQLQWMREKGVAYLIGSPIARPAKGRSKADEAVRLPKAS